MDEYTETFLDHYRRPRNSGDLAAPDAVAIVHDDVCGDILRLAIGVETSTDASAVTRVCAARFKAFGCAATIAVASLVTEWVIGKSVEQARKLDDADIRDALGGLPPGRVHAAILGREALRAALARLEQNTGATER